MKIVDLIENTSGICGCTPAHGLSFYIETDGHRLLMDAGPSALTVKNAGYLGIDLSAVDTVILSHGHYDHADGLSEFIKINKTAKIYAQRSALGEYFAVDDGRERYIGIAEDIKKSGRIIPIDGELKIDDELSVFSGITGRRHFPFTNKRLYKKTADGLVLDDFLHEQCLAVSHNGIKILFSGCAHNGVLNILDRYIALYGTAPDYMISGFHLAKKTDFTTADIDEIRAAAEEMKKYGTRFITCHCTGETAYLVIKEILGDRLGYVHCGEEIQII